MLLLSVLLVVMLRIVCAMPNFVFILTDDQDLLLKGLVRDLHHFFTQNNLFVLIHLDTNEGHFEIDS